MKPYALLAILTAVGFGIWLWTLPPRKIEVIRSRETIPKAPTVAKAPIPTPKRLNSPRRIVDSKMSRSQALGSNSFPKTTLARMALIDVSYVGFDGLDHHGQMVIEKSLAEEVRQIFAELRKIRYPIQKVVPVVRYDWDDLRSMRDNNTSGFNYRGQVTPNGKSRILSKHAYGRAIDLNPYVNPYVSRTGKSISPYRRSAKGALTRDSAATRIFLSYGWEWGGNWPGGKDYQHFVKPAAPSKTAR